MEARIRSRISKINKLIAEFSSLQSRYSNCLTTFGRFQGEHIEEEVSLATSISQLSLKREGQFELIKIESLTLLQKFELALFEIDGIMRSCYVIIHIFRFFEVFIIS